MWITAAIAASLAAALVAIVYFAIQDHEQRRAGDDAPRPRE